MKMDDNVHICHAYIEKRNGQNESQDNTKL